jgi:hypothetical protein
MGEDAKAGDSLGNDRQHDVEKVTLSDSGEQACPFRTLGIDQPAKMVRR